jgi:hypothetical protein
MKIGSIIAISISNIIKIIAIIKKWIENEIRDEEKFENPHSNGEDLLISIIDFLEIKNDVDINKINKNIIIKRLINIFIFSLKIKPFNWKLIILFILKKNLFHQYKII